MYGDVANALLTALTTERDMRPIAKARIVEKSFENAGQREIFRWVLTRFETRGKVPSLNLLRTQFPDFEPEDVTDSLEFLVETFQDKRKYVEIQRAVRKVVAAAKGDPNDAIKALVDEAARIQLETGDASGSVDLTKSGAAIRKKTKQFLAKKGMLGIPWPWPRMNKLTRGMRKGAFYGVYGDPGSLKTWLLIYILDHAHRFEGARPILFTQEMPAEDIQIRWAALRGQIDYEDYLNGDISPKELKRLYRELDTLVDELPFLVEEMDLSGKAGLAFVKAKIKEAKATLFGVDGVGDMSDDSEWGSFWAVCKGLKSICRNGKLPGVATHHTNRDRSKSGEYNPEKENDAKDVALGEAFFRYVDGLWRLVRTPQMIESQEIFVHTKKIREGKMPCKFTIHGMPALSFEQKSADDDQPQFSDDEDGSFKSDDDE